MLYLEEGLLKEDGARDVLAEALGGEKESAPVWGGKVVVRPVRVARAGWLKVAELVEPVGRGRGRDPGELGLAAVVAGEWVGGAGPARTAAVLLGVLHADRLEAGAHGLGRLVAREDALVEGTRQGREPVWWVGSEGGGRGRADGGGGERRGRTKHPAALDAQSRLTQVQPGQPPSAARGGGLQLVRTLPLAAMVLAVLASSSL